MNIPKWVEIIEVGPRDGLQNEQKFISTDLKIQLINSLNQAGIKRIEVTSFVSPKHVPQMADADIVYRNCDKKKDIQYMALIPNKKGYQLAVNAGVTSLSMVVGVSETFNRKNVSMSIEESLVQLEEVIEEAKKSKIFIRFYLSTAFWCPYEGKVHEKHTLNMVKRLEKFEVDEIVVCETIGRANPAQVYRVFNQVLELEPKAKVTAHLHDTYGFSHANALAALYAGVSSFDTSIGGLGGCPFAPGAAGNCPTEDFVFMLSEMGVETGVDYPKLLECVGVVKTFTERKLSGRLHMLS